jgi:hypothetical protein
MFNDLVNAVQNIVDPINGLMSIADYTAFGGKKYEHYIQHKILCQLNNNFVSEIHHLNRRFDIVEKAGNNFMNVCEVGHERSNQGDLLNISRTNIKKNGLVNKLFFDYIKNYQYQNFTPVSYAVLFFSIVNVSHLANAEGMMLTIQNLYGEGRAKKLDAQNINQQIFGKIIIIDAINSLDEVRILYQNNINIQQYVKPIEKGINKHEILMQPINN